MSARVNPLASRSGIARAETIALLYLLHPVPLSPSSNPVDSRVPRLSDSYSLTFEKERELCGTLAFLSYTRNDPDCIPAVCLMETQQPASIKVLLAVNKGKPNENNPTLEKMERGFRAIFAILRGVDGIDSTATTEQHVFRAIVAMCAQRILYRLRLVAKGRNALKSPLKSVIQRALQSLQQLRREQTGDGVSHNVVPTFITRAKEVLGLIDAWKKHQTLDRLGMLVEGIRRLRLVEELRTLLDSIPNVHMESTSRDSLYNIVCKVARYREAASLLARLARKTPIVRQMEAVAVNLPESAFHNVPAGKGSSVLTSVFARIGAPHGRQENISQACRLLGHDLPDFGRRHSQQTQKILKQAKIHAEIQLLYHCALQAVQTPPRIVCSSKDACFLCNSFILAHGRMHVPRSHGRLYPGWRLPHLPVLLDVEERFGQMLLNHARDSLSTLLTRRKKTVYPPPGESTLLTLIHSRSTIVSLGVPHVDPGDNVGTVSAQSTGDTRTPPTGPTLLFESGTAHTLLEQQSKTTSQSDTSQETNDNHKARSRNSSSSASTQLTAEDMAVVSGRKQPDLEGVQRPEKATTTVCANEDVDKDKPPSVGEGSMLSGEMVNESEAVAIYHTPPGPAAGEVASYLLNSQFRNISDLDRQRIRAAVMKGHESRICVTRSECITAKAELDYTLAVIHSDRVSRKIDFHDMELFLEVESPATASVCIRPRPPCEIPDGVQVVDVGCLVAGEDVTLQVEKDFEGKSRLRLTSQDGFGHGQQWDMDWKIVC